MNASNYKNSAGQNVILWEGTKGKATVNFFTGDVFVELVSGFFYKTTTKDLDTVVVEING